jgi:hypothetical protein
MYGYRLADRGAPDSGDERSARWIESRGQRVLFRPRFGAANFAYSSGASANSASSAFEPAMLVTTTMAKSRLGSIQVWARFFSLDPPW